MKKGDNKMGTEKEEKKAGFLSPTNRWSIKDVNTSATHTSSQTNAQISQMLTSILASQRIRSLEIGNSDFFSGCLRPYKLLACITDRYNNFCMNSKHCYAIISFST